MAETHDVLVNFLTLLHNGKYAEAAPLYGGDYEALQVFNPEIDPADKAALWTWACDNQLLQCLEVRSATFKNLSGISAHLPGRIQQPGRQPVCAGSMLRRNGNRNAARLTIRIYGKWDAKHRYVVMNPPPYVP